MAVLRYVEKEEELVTSEKTDYCGFVFKGEISKQCLLNKGIKEWIVIVNEEFNGQTNVWYTETIFASIDEAMDYIHKVGVDYYFADTLKELFRWMGE